MDKLLDNIKINEGQNISSNTARDLENAVKKHGKLIQNVTNTLKEANNNPQNVAKIKSMDYQDTLDIMKEATKEFGAISKNIEKEIKSHNKEHEVLQKSLNNVQNKIKKGKTRILGTKKLHITPQNNVKEYNNKVPTNIDNIVNPNPETNTVIPVSVSSPVADILSQKINEGEKEVKFIQEVKSQNQDKNIQTKTPITDTKPSIFTRAILEAQKLFDDIFSFGKSNNKAQQEITNKNDFTKSVFTSQNDFAINEPNTKNVTNLGVTGPKVGTNPFSNKFVSESAQLHPSINKNQPNDLVDKIKNAKKYEDLPKTHELFQQPPSSFSPQVTKEASKIVHEARNKENLPHKSVKSDANRNQDNLKEKYRS